MAANTEVRGLPVQPGLDDRAVQDQTDNVFPGQAASAPGTPVDLHLPPGPADHVLADGSIEQAMECPLDPAHIGPGQIDRGDQRLGLPGQPLIAWQRLWSAIR